MTAQDAERALNASLKPSVRIPKAVARQDSRVAVAAGELAAGGLEVGGAHQRLADQHGVDADALELVELLARVEARLRDDRLARRDVGEQLVGALDVDA